MTATHVALLRGINVGKAKRVAMSDLRAVIESLGYTDARTLLNSGNAVFRSARPPGRGAADALQRALERRTGVSSRFTLRTADELRKVVRGNPHARIATDPSRHFVAFVTDPARVKLLVALSKQSWTPESLVVGEGVAYIWCPAGLMESKASEAVMRVLGDGVTVRNWATVMKLAALLEGQD